MSIHIQGFGEAWAVRRCLSQETGKRSLGKGKHDGGIAAFLSRAIVTGQSSVFLRSVCCIAPTGKG